MRQRNSGTLGGHVQMVNCTSCGKLTHSGIDGHVSLNLCRACFEDAGMENEHNDTGGQHYRGISSKPGPHPDCRLCREKMEDGPESSDFN